MKRLPFFILFFSIMFSAQVGSTVLVDDFQASASRIVLKVEDDLAPLPGRSAPLDLSSNTELSEILNVNDATELKPLFKDWNEFGFLHIKHDLHRYYIAEFGRAVEVNNLMNDLYFTPGVEDAEADFIVNMAVVPNDNFYDEQWAHNNYGQAGSSNVGIPDCDTDTEEAWDITTGTADIIVAILDTGINGSHAEFSGKMVPGYDFVNNDDDGSDDQGHGTSCAGIAAARGNNGIGVAGVSWDSNLMPIKVLNSGGSGNDTDIANGITWASDNGARIVSMSLSGGGYTGYLDSAINYANDNGTVVFVATGNEGDNVCAYPSCYDGSIAVGALSPCNERKNPGSCDGENWWGSNYGDHMDFLSPGVLIYTTSMNGGYTSSFNGTSSACPHAAGIGALILSASPGLSPEQVRTVMQITADELYAPGYDIESGHGRLNAFQAVSYSMSAPEFTMEVESLAFEVGSGETDTETIAVINMGDDDLSFTIDPDSYFTTDSDGEYIDYEWIEIEDIGTQLSFTHNDQAAAESISLDFPFTFYGEVYTESIVNANGWIGFGEDSNAWDNGIIPDPDGPRPAVMGYWDDLNPNNSGNSNLMSGDVYYHGNSSRLVVWFDHVVHWYGSNEIDGTYDFQMILYADGSIRFNYRTMEGEIELGTIGIQNEAGDEAVLVSYNQAYTEGQKSVQLQTMHDWMTVAPLDAVIPPGDAAELEISIDTAGLPEGIYQDWIYFTTNDYANLHPTLHVTTAVGTSDCSSWNQADVNNDGIINVLDIIVTVNIITGEYETPTICEIWAADVNSDELLNILDLVEIVNIIVGE